MNKEIKVIDLIDKIYHKNNIPKRIKYKNKIWLYDNVEERYCLEDSFVSLAFETDRLNDKVEILEDNTEEIEEIEEIEELEYYYIGQEKSANLTKIIDKIEEIRVAVNQLRKEKK